MFKTILALLVMGSTANAAYLKLSDEVGGKVYARVPTTGKAIAALGPEGFKFRVYGTDCTFKADGPGNSTVTVACDGGDAIVGVSLDCDHSMMIRTKKNLTTVKLICEEI